MAFLLMQNIKKEFINKNQHLFMGENDDEPLYNRNNPLINAVACHKIPDIAILDQKMNLLDHKVVKEHFKNEGRLNNQQIVKVFKDAMDVLCKESNVLKIEKPCYVFGDTHGQFYDLISILDVILEKAIKENCAILFVGDYVDRGVFSCEVFIYLILLKSHFPETIFMTRGNHESLRMTTYFTHKAETLHKYNSEVYKLFCNAFNSLPLCAVIQKQAFCSHGGIGPKIKKVSEINSINRFTEVPYEGTFCDLLWSDPHPAYDFDEIGSFESNDQRNTSFYYSFSDVKQFLTQNNLKVIIRGHEVQETGYKLYKEFNDHPSVITIFSAPNYCDAYKNTGAILFFDQGLKQIDQFYAVKHPYVLKEFMDGITWSFPFLAEKLLQFTHDLLEHQSSMSSCSGLDICDHSIPLLDEETQKLMENEEKMKANIIMLRTERECIDEFVDEDSTLECCNLVIKDQNDLDFNEAKEIDAQNEEIKKTPKMKSVNFGMNVSPSMATAELNEARKGSEEIFIEHHTDKTEKVCHYTVEEPKIEKTPKESSEKCSWFNFLC